MHQLIQKSIKKVLHNHHHHWSLSTNISILNSASFEGKYTLNIQNIPLQRGKFKPFNSYLMVVLLYSIVRGLLAKLLR